MSAKAPVPERAVDVVLKLRRRLTGGMIGAEQRGVVCEDERELQLFQYLGYTRARGVAVDVVDSETLGEKATRYTDAVEF